MRRRHGALPARPARGFVLPLTLAVLVAVTLVAAYLGERVQRSLQLAQARQQLNEAELALASARAELLYRLATRAMSPCGLGWGADCIALDDRAYAVGESWARLQDGRGLLSLAQAPDEALDRLLASFGVPPQRRAALIDVLRDYTDADNLRRLNGAEAREYEAAGLPPPRNAPLTSPQELRALLGWRDEAALWKVPSIADFTTVGPVLAVNPNTAPEAVLQTLPGVTPELARALVARRQVEPVSADLLDRMVGGGIVVLPPRAIGFPADTVRITQGAPGLPWVLRYNVQVSPQDASAPWRVAFFHRAQAGAPEAAAPSAAPPAASSAAPAALAALPARSVAAAQPPPVVLLP